MVQKSVWWVGGGLIVFLSWGGWYSNRNQHARPNINEPIPAAQVVQVSSPQENALVASPLAISGIAPGTWFFEASLPVSLVDEVGKELARTPAQAQSDWMVEGPVPFQATLTFATPATATGYLVVQNDNPSGLPQFEKSYRIKVRFK